MRDIVVIGAGPAGSVAAERLARAGLDVLVLEEHAEIGQPVHCTGLLGDEAFAEFDLPQELVLGRPDGARFWGAAGRSVHVQSGAVRAAIIDRAGLDVMLALRARSSGAEIRLSSRVESITVDHNGLEVRLQAGGAPVRAQACILACGANYRFHRTLNLGLPAAFLQSAQVDIPFPERSGIEVRFGRNVAPGGFAWVVPFTARRASRARIGLMAETRARERFRAFVSELGVPTSAAIDPRLKMLPLAPVARTFNDRVLAVGDAAGLVKPTTGGGIYYGMLSGAMAADTLATAFRQRRLDHTFLARYEQQWRRRLGREIHAGVKFRGIMAGLNDDSIDALINLAAVNGVVPLLQKTASFNWHRRAATALLGHPAFRKIVLGRRDTVPPPA